MASSSWFSLSIHPALRKAGPDWVSRGPLETSSYGPGMGGISGALLYGYDLPDGRKSVVKFGSRHVANEAEKHEDLHGKGVDAIPSFHGRGSGEFSGPWLGSEDLNDSGYVPIDKWAPGKTPDQITAAFVNASKGLQSIQDAGYQHNDTENKPDHVWINPETGHVKFIDLGNARRIDDSSNPYGPERDFQGLAQTFRDFTPEGSKGLDDALKSMMDKRGGGASKEKREETLANLDTGLAGKKIFSTPWDYSKKTSAASAAAPAAPVTEPAPVAETPAPVAEPAATVGETAAPVREPTPEEIEARRVRRDDVRDRRFLGPERRRDMRTAASPPPPGAVYVDEPGARPDPLGLRNRTDAPERRMFTSRQEVGARIKSAASRAVAAGTQGLQAASSRLDSLRGRSATPVGEPAATPVGEPAAAPAGVGRRAFQSVQNRLSGLMNRSTKRSEPADASTTTVDSTTALPSDAPAAGAAKPDAPVGIGQRARNMAQSTITSLQEQSKKLEGLSERAKTSVGGMFSGKKRGPLEADERIKPEDPVTQPGSGKGLRTPYRPEPIPTPVTPQTNSAKRGQGKATTPAGAASDPEASKTGIGEGFANYQSGNVFGDNASVIGRIGTQNNYSGTSNEDRRNRGQKISDAAKEIHNETRIDSSPEGPNPFDRTASHLSRSMAKSLSSRKSTMLYLKRTNT